MKFQQVQNTYATKCTTSADVTVSETAGLQIKNDASVCRHRGLSLTAPLEFCEQASANAIKTADGLV